jgi:tetrahydromethanopterin S-methyltransferase subunit B
MLPTSADALVERAIDKEQIKSLATLYDRFAHALDPFSPQRDEAERVFMQEVAGIYDSLHDSIGGVSHHDFRKAIILRCKRYLAATDKPTSI